MDIFDTDAFSVIELTRALENIPYTPATLSGSGLFSPRGVRARSVVIESRDGTLSLIPFSERGSAYEQQIPERRDVRAFVCRQFKKQDVLWGEGRSAPADAMVQWTIARSERDPGHPGVWCRERDPADPGRGRPPAAPSAQ